jgi:hypothetical protein
VSAKARRLVTSFFDGSFTGLTGALVGRSGRSSQRWVVTGPPPEAAIVFQLLLDGKVTYVVITDAGRRALADVAGVGFSCDVVKPLTQPRPFSGCSPEEGRGSRC